MSKKDIDKIAKVLIDLIQQSIGNGINDRVEKTIKILHGTLPENASDTDKRKPWYFSSYTYYLREVEHFLNESNGKLSNERKEAFLIMMVSFVGSWVASIPKAALWDGDNNCSVISHLLSLRGISITEIDPSLVTSGKRVKSFSIKRCTKEHQESIVLDAYLESINILLNGKHSKAKRANLATVSKFLHFSHPDLFPVLDENINKTVFSHHIPDLYTKNSPQLAAYAVYIAAIKQLLIDTKSCGHLTIFRDALAVRGMNVGYLRAVDLILF